MRRYPAVSDFLVAAAGLLARDEAGHALVSAVVDTLRMRPELAERRPYLAVVERDGEVAGAAAMLPPNPLTLSPLTPPRALPLLAADLVDDGRIVQVVDVSAPVEVVEPFMAAWRERTGRDWQPLMRERLHRIDAAPQVPATPGHFRMADAADLELLLDWSVAFQEEAWHGGLNVDRERLRTGVEARVAGRDGGAGLWVDGETVAMAAYFSAEPPAAARVAPVYTPPSLRGRGYGTAVTAALTRTAFARGHRLCMLFTDVSNPTSNHIYAAIGYRPVAEWMHARVRSS